MTRIIGRLDVKGQRLIKGVQYEGVRVLGNALDYAKKYYHQGIDELIYLDAVASLYGRPSMEELLINTVEEVFVPVTAGGGISSVDDVNRLLKSGADKVAINTAVISNPHLITEVADKFGIQCVVASIQAKKIKENRWEVYVDCGRERTGIDVLEWAAKVESLGAGEILITSIDRDGTVKGGDVDLFRAVSSSSSIPVIASGGIGSVEDFYETVDTGLADAVAIGKALHFGEISISSIRNRISTR